MKYFLGVFLALSALTMGTAHAAEATDIGANLQLTQQDSSVAPEFFPPGGFVVIRCQSFPNSSNYCPAGGPVSYAQLRYQFAGPACVQGYTWGYDGGGVWTSNGCAGDFNVYFQNTPPPQQFQDLQCWSTGDHYTQCLTMFRQVTQAQLLSQQSHQSCIQGRNWGVNGPYIWVDNGCRGYFRAWGY